MPTIIPPATQPHAETLRARPRAWFWMLLALLLVAIGALVVLVSDDAWKIATPVALLLASPCAIRANYLRRHEQPIAVAVETPVADTHVIWSASDGTPPNESREPRRD